MSEVELVIKIPEDTYTHLCNGGNIGASLLIENAIKNGTPLPKGHGDLIDANKTITNAYEVYSASGTHNIITSDQMYAIRKALTTAQPIIKADEEKEDIMSYITGATLLSVEEAKNLNKEILKADKDWWLRSPGDSAPKAAFVHGPYGFVDVNGYYVIQVFGVRPALEINNLESSGYKIGESVYFGDRSFTIISDTYALCDDIIGECIFCKDSIAKNANEYEASDIKRYVESWFEKVKEQSREERDSEEEREV